MFDFHQGNNARYMMILMCEDPETEKRRTVNEIIFKKLAFPFFLFLGKAGWLIFLKNPRYADTLLAIRTNSRTV